MNTQNCVLEAAQRTVQDPLAPELGYGQVFKANLEVGAADLPFPEEGSSAIDYLGYAWLNRDAGPEERQRAAMLAVDGVRDRIIGCASIIGVLDGESVVERAAGYSADLTRKSAELAASYPATQGADALLGTMAEVVEGASGQNREGRAVATCVALDIVKPYLAKRLTEINPYDAAAASAQLKVLQDDVLLMRDLSQAMSHALEFTLTGATDISVEEIANRMFEMGPIFVKLGQSAAGMAHNASGHRADLVEQVGEALQGGVAPPSERQQAEMAKNLPEGLVYEGVISGASIANITAVRTEDGTRLIDKTPRPNIEQALADNERSYTIVSEVFREFLRTHAGDSAAVQQLEQMHDVLPFLLHVMRLDIEGELDFVHERKMQQDAREMLQTIPSVHVPETFEQYCTDTHIVMEEVRGVRIKDAPANPKYLENLTRMVVRFFKGAPSPDGDKKLRLIHGDMHAKNIQALADETGQAAHENGDIVAYDWGRTVEYEPGMIRRLSSFLVASARKNPKAIAKSYLKIQSPLHTQITYEEALATAADTVRAVREQSMALGRKGTRRLLYEANAVTQSFIIALGLRHKSTIDSDYLALMKSSGSLMAVVRGELAKPYYKTRGNRVRALFRTARAAINEARN